MLILEEKPIYDLEKSSYPLLGSRLDVHSCLKSSRDRSLAATTLKRTDKEKILSQRHEGDINPLETLLVLPIKFLERMKTRLS